MNKLELTQIANCQLLHSGLCQHVGLFDGKMGIAIFLFCYARYSQNIWYGKFAEELLDDLFQNITINTPIGFATGLSGIGWGIEFMTKQGFVEGDTDEVLSDIDKKIMEWDVRRITDTSLETGLEGVVTYVKSRLKTKDITSPEQPFNYTYLVELKEACQKHALDWESNQFDMDFTWTKILDTFKKESLTESEHWKNGLILLRTNDL